MNYVDNLITNLYRLECEKRELERQIVFLRGELEEEMGVREDVVVEGGERRVSDATRTPEGGRLA